MPRISVEQDIDRKGSMDVLINSDEFRMYCFKVLPCSKHYSHDWTICPFAHPGEKARRRDPRVFKYAGVECPHVKEGLRCPRGDLCPFAHNIFECWLHPTRYRTQLCNEPASCKRKVCFFAHALEELREPSNPIDTLPEGGIGSGIAPRMSLDGLVNANAINGLLTATATAANQPQRQSIDVASLSQLRTNLDPAASQINVNNLLSELQALNVQDQVRQNQQLATQLVVGLLGELAAQKEQSQHQQHQQNQHQQQQHLTSLAANAAAAAVQQCQQDLIQQSNLGFGTGVSATATSMTPTPLAGTQSLPRWSVDGHTLATPNYLPTNQFPIQSAFQYPQSTVHGGAMMSMYTTPESPINRGASFESSMRDTVTQSMSSVGRGASIDNSSLMQTTPISPQQPHVNGLHHHPFISQNKNTPKQNFQSIVEDPGHSSDDGSSSGPSSTEYSTDCQKSESFPVSYQFDGVAPSRDSNVDSTLPEPFILF
eukprot:g6947.t1